MTSLGDGGTTTDDRRDEATRTRLVWTMFGANGLASTAFIGVVTVAPILAETLTGSERLAGLPSTAATVGTAAGAIVLGGLGARRGRRPTFAGGFAIAGLGALAAVLAVRGASLPLLVVALLVLGFGRSVSQLARYAAGDLRSEQRRGRAISLVVWASTIGAVVGPLLIEPAGDVAVAAGMQAELGAVALAGALFGGGAVVLAVALRPEPLRLSVRDPGTPATVSLDVGADLPRVRALLRRPSVRLSVAVLVTSQLVMVLVMTMTPLHIRGAGQGLGAVGRVMSAHTLGMFALAPLTGWLVDRVGARTVMAAGGVLLVASCLLATPAGGADQRLLVGSLFGLGYGWNLGFVAASTHLQHGLTVPERARLQGVADAATWLAGGLGAAVSGTIVAAASYGALATTGAALALAVPIALVVTARAARTA